MDRSLGKCWFKSFADAELRYDFKQVLADEQQGQQFSDDTTHRGRFSLESGTDFSRLQWTFLTQASYTDRSQAHDIERADADLELEYFASPVVSFIAAGAIRCLTTATRETRWMGRAGAWHSPT